MESMEKEKETMSENLKRVELEAQRVRSDGRTHPIGGKCKRNYLNGKF